MSRRVTTTTAGLVLSAAVVAFASCGSSARQGVAPNGARHSTTTANATTANATTTVSATTSTTLPTVDTTPVDTAPSSTATTRAGTPATTGGPTPPASTSPPPVSGHGLAGKVITINPGHAGGNGSHPSEINRQVWIGSGWKACDTAGTQTNAGYPEHAFTWDTSLRVAAKLRALGATVVMTRQNDTGWGPCIDARARIGNQAHSAAVVSIHADGGPATGRGFFVIAPALIAGLTDDIYSASGRLAGAVRDAVQRGTAMPTSNYSGSGGYLTSGIYGGLNLADVPAMFIECGNMRNATDAALLGSAAYRDQLATAIVQGIANYVG